MSQKDLEVMEQLLFAGDYELKEIKSWQTRFRPKQEWVHEVLKASSHSTHEPGGKSTAEGVEDPSQSRATSYQEGESHSVTWSESWGESESFSESESLGEFSSEGYSGKDRNEFLVTGYTYTEGVSESKGRTMSRSTSRTQGKASFISASDRGESIARTILNEFKSPGKTSHFTLEEQRYKLQSLLRMLPPQNAVVKFEGFPPKVLRLRRLPAPHNLKPEIRRKRPEKERQETLEPRPLGGEESSTSEEELYSIICDLLDALNTA